MLTIPRVSYEVLVPFSIALFMLLQLTIVRGGSGLSVKPRVAGLMIPVFLGVAVALTVLLMTVKLSAFGALLAFAIRDIGLMFFALSLGYAISTIVREPNVLLPVAIFAALVDFWSVNYGPLGMLLATRPEVVEAAAVQMPVVGRMMPVSVIGVGDFVFLALYFAVMHRFRMNVRGAFWLGFFLLTLTMLAVILVDWLSAVPALVPIGIAVLVANRKHIRLKRDEVISTLLVGIVLVTLIVLSTVLASGR